MPNRVARKAALSSLAAAVALGVQAPGAWAQKQKTYMFGSGSELSFVVSHALRKGVRGYSKEVCGSILLPDSGKFEQAQVGATIPLTTFVSHRAGLTQHMFSTLNAARYPQVAFKSRSITVRASEKVDGGTRVSGAITGAITFHGVEKLVTTPFSALIEEDSIIADTSFDLKLSDYEIDRPRFLGLALDDLVRIKGKLEAKRQVRL